MDPIKLSTEPRRVETIPFEIDDDSFVFIPPKDSILTLSLLRSKSDDMDIMDQAQQLFEFVRIGMDQADRVVHGRKINADGSPTDGEEDEWAEPTQWQRIVTRLEDSSDDLDIKPVVQLFAKLIKAGRSGDNPSG